MDMWWEITRDAKDYHAGGRRQALECQAPSVYERRVDANVTNSDGAEQ